MLFDPFQEIMPTWGDDAFFGSGFKLNADVYQDKDNVIIEVDVPGVKEENLDITVKDDVLTVSGSREENQELKKEDYYQKETRSGSFSRSIFLPMQVKSNEARAIFKKGVLKITLPKAEETKTRRIKIETNK